jgi:hypothetical protein
VISIRGIHLYFIIRMGFKLAFVSEVTTVTSDIGSNMGITLGIINWIGIVCGACQMFEFNSERHSG